MLIQRGGLESLRGGLGQVRVPLIFVGGEKGRSPSYLSLQMMLLQPKMVPRLVPGQGMSQRGQRLVQSLLGLVLVLRMWSQSVIVSERFCFMCNILGPHGVLDDMQQSLLVCIVCWGTSCSWFCPPCHQLFNRGKTRAWWWSRFKEPHHAIST